MNAARTIEARFPGFSIESSAHADDAKLQQMFQSFLGTKTSGVRLFNNAGARILILTAPSIEAPPSIEKPASIEEPLSIEVASIPLPTEPRPTKVPPSRMAALEWDAGQESSDSFVLETLSLDTDEILATDPLLGWEFDFLTTPVLVTTEEVVEDLGEVRRKRKRVVQRDPLLHPGDLHDGELDVIASLMTMDRPKRQAAIRAELRITKTTQGPPAKRQRRPSTVQVVKETDACCPICLGSLKGTDVTLMDCCRAAVHDHCMEQLRQHYDGKSEYLCPMCRTDLSGDNLSAILPMHTQKALEARKKYPKDKRNRRVATPLSTKSARPPRPWRCKHEHRLRNGLCSWKTFSTFKRLLSHAATKHGETHFSAVTRTGDSFRTACQVCSQEISWTGDPALPMSALQHLIQRHEGGRWLGNSKLSVH